MSAGRTAQSTLTTRKLIGELIDRHPVMIQKSKGALFKVKYASMIKAAPPTFLIFSNKSKGIPENYRKYLSKGIRKEFDLKNTPVHLVFRTRSEIARKVKRS